MAAMTLSSATTPGRDLAAPPGTLALAWAGLAGPPLFVLGVIVQQASRGAAYSPIQQQISDLTAGGAGWAQQLNFALFGVLVIAFAVGLHRGVAPARGGIVGPALLAVNGLNLVVAGLFPLRLNDAGLVHDPLGVHSVNGRIFFFSLGIAPLLLALRLRHDPRWRRLAGYVLGSGTALLVAVVLVVTLALPAASVLHPWLGSAQRVIVLIWSATIIVLAWRLRLIAAAGQSGTEHETAPWARKFGIAVMVIAGLIAMMMFFGGKHGPGMHSPGMQMNHGLPAGIGGPR